MEQIGITHEITGDLLSTHWHLFDYLSEVMRRHHDVEKATLEPVLACHRQHRRSALPNLRPRLRLPGKHRGQPAGRARLEDPRRPVAAPAQPRHGLLHPGNRKLRQGGQDAGLGPVPPLMPAPLVHPVHLLICIHIPAAGSAEIVINPPGRSQRKPSGMEVSLAPGGYSWDSIYSADYNLSVSSKAD